MCSPACAKTILFVFNFVFWLAGAGVLGIGIWMKVDPTIVNYLLVVDIDGSDSFISHAASLFIAVGAFVFLVGFLGCCGALRESQCMLFMYAALVLIVMVAEIVAAILVLIYHGKVESHLRESMETQIRDKYKPDTDAKKAWDFLQVDLKCCGGSGKGDYLDSHWWNETRREEVNGTAEVVPATCCKLTEKNAENPQAVNWAQCQKDASKDVEDSEFFHSQGCYDGLMGWFKTQSLILMIVGFVVGGIQIIGFIAACSLRSALKRTKHTEA